MKAHESKHRRVTLITQSMQAPEIHGATKKPSPEDRNNGKTVGARPQAERLNLCFISNRPDASTTTLADTDAQC